MESKRKSADTKTTLDDLKPSWISSQDFRSSFLRILPKFKLKYEQASKPDIVETDAVNVSLNYEPSLYCALNRRSIREICDSISYICDCLVFLPPGTLHFSLLNSTIFRISVIFLCYQSANLTLAPLLISYEANYASNIAHRFVSSQTISQASIDATVCPSVCLSVCPVSLQENIRYRRHQIDLSFYLAAWNADAV